MLAGDLLDAMVLRRSASLIVVDHGLPCPRACRPLSQYRLQPVSYTASVSILVSPDSQASMLDYQAVMVSERLALTYSQMLRDRVATQAVVAQLGLDESPEALVKRVKAEPIPNTQLIRLTVSDSSSEQAGFLANAFTDAFAARMQDMQGERFSGIETAHPSRGVTHARS